MSLARLFMLMGSVGGFLSVAFGAFGAHALKDRLDAYHLSVFKTGVEYQFLHSLALLLLGALSVKVPEASLKWTGYAFVLGILIFSGSLYTLALTGTKAWGAVTPLGGVAFLVGWLLLANAVRQAS